MAKAKTSYKKESGASDKYVKGMSKEDIYKKISVLKTEDSKISYLKSLEPKIGFMSPSTRKAFYEVIGENYEKLGDKGKGEKRSILPHETREAQNEKNDGLKQYIRIPIKASSGQESYIKAIDAYSKGSADDELAELNLKLINLNKEGSGKGSYDLILRRGFAQLNESNIHNPKTLKKLIKFYSSSPNLSEKAIKYSKRLNKK